MNIQPSVLNRLIAARHLIETAGQELTTFSDSRDVARKVLVAHDATELTLLALIAQFALPVPELDGSQKKEPSFLAMARAVVTRSYDNDPAYGPSLELLNELNQVRVAFKHYGRLPDTASSYHLFSDVVDLLNDLCTQLLHWAILRVDYTAAIQSEEIRDHFANARALIEEQDYQRSLAATAFGLAAAFWNLQVPTYIQPGKPSSEDALLLSGRGIDPASFLTMQKLLPEAHYTEEEVTWRTRETGHKANWTRENAEFCLSTAISTVVRLQSAPVLPRLIDFYNEFEDVIEILVEQPEVFLGRVHIFGGSEHLERIDKFGKGAKIMGQAVGKLGIGYEPSQDLSPEEEYATYVVLSNPRLEAVGDSDPGVGILGRYPVLWFKREEVKLSYQRNPTHERWQKMISPNMNE